MNVRRYVGATAREAMRQLKAELGDEALILANRSCAQGVEILATVEQALQFASGSALNAGSAKAASAKEAGKASAAEPVSANVVSPAAPEPAKSAMSTLSFQEYVRNRLAKAQPKPQPQPQPQPQAQAQPPLQPQPVAQEIVADPAPALVATPTPASVVAQAPTVASPEPVVWRARSSAADSPELMEQLLEVKSMLSKQVDSAVWLSGGSAQSVRAQLSRQLLDAGFSPGLIRYLMEHMPEGFSLKQAQDWIEKALERNCRTSTAVLDLIAQGGVCALIGPTGVGKTTTIAKLAARAVMRHGAKNVALVTIDNFRVGAFEQLKVYGQILSVPVSSSSDKVSLADILQRCSDKKVVLIDTVGLSQKDERVSSVLAALDQPRLRRIFVASASAQGDTIDRAIKAFGVAKGDAVILTKLDEVERLAPALDCIVRHGLSIAGLADGQRVPQDWRATDSLMLARQALKQRDRDQWHFDEQTALHQLHQSSESQSGFHA